MIEASLHVVAPPTKRTEVLEVLRSLKGPTEAAIGCQACWILQDIDNENSLTYIVRWDSQRDLEEHVRSDRFRRLLPYIEMSVLPPDAQVNSVDRIGGIEFLVSVLGSNESPIP